MRHVLLGNAGDFGDDVFYLAFADAGLAVFRLPDAFGCAGFVDDVYRFVGQEAFVDVFGGEFGGSLKGIVCVFHFVVFFKHGFQAVQNLHGFVHARFVDVYLLEAAAQRVVFAEYGAVFFIGGGADAAQGAFCQRGFEQVGRIQHAALRAARADECVDFVYKQ